MSNKIAKQTAQQGDILFVKINQLPSKNPTEKTTKNLIIAHGESGHSHVVNNDSASLLLIGEKLFLQLESDATVEHEEHKPITLEKGVWEIGHVQEYDWFSKMQRSVID